MQTGVDRDLVWAVMAVEHGERGALARSVEYAYAVGLCAVGRRAHAEWVSVGPAQVQLRHEGMGSPMMPRLIRMAGAGGSAMACARVIARECNALGIDASSPGAWEAECWHAFGLAYCGELASGYGDAVRMVHAGLPTAPGPLGQEPQPTLA